MLYRSEFRWKQWSVLWGSNDLYKRLWKQDQKFKDLYSMAQVLIYYLDIPLDTAPS